MSKSKCTVYWGDIPNVGKFKSLVVIVMRVDDNFEIREVRVGSG